MKHTILSIVFASFCMLFLISMISGCTNMEDSALSVIPKPLKMKSKKGAFLLNESTQILIEADSPEVKDIALYMADWIEKASGLKLTIKETTESKVPENTILLTTAKADTKLGKEGYTLNANKKAVILQGQPAGLFYAVQTLFQLLPPEIYSTESVQTDIDWSIPAVNIKDKPRFEWRGMHLDVARHFYSVEFIKKYINYLALHKFNTLHLHLTDDQGWRIEIKKYPRLTEIGSYRDQTIVGHNSGTRVYDGERYGGYYTQENIRDIVQYAKERFITVLPEIEMPGHSVAVLTAYSQFSCTGGPFKVRQEWGISDDIVCAGNDQVFHFLEDVLTEVINLFPSKYIHIGGDEAPKVRWEKCPKCQKRIKEEGLKDEHELQSYFIQRIEKFLNSKGRQIIGWDEILEGGLAPNAAVMSWRGTEGGIAAAQQNHNVVMSPTTYCYFDYYQADPSLEPLAIGGFLPMEKVYEFEPVPEELSAEQSKYILGAQANVWTEYIKTEELLEYMALPRMCALAEVVWSAKEQRNLESFLQRMSAHYSRMDEMGIHYFRAPLEGIRARTVFLNETTVKIKTQQRDSQVRYTLDGSEPTNESALYTAPIIITNSTVLKAREFLANGKTTRTIQGEYVKQTLTESIPLQNAVKGLSFHYYDIKDQIYSTTELTNLKPKSAGTVDIIKYPYDQFVEHFGIIFTGYIKLPANGIYTFTTDTNDGSCLYIGDQLVVENDGSHGSQERDGQIALKAGYHPFRMTYFQAGGGKALKAYIAGPGIEKQVIPAGMLWHK